MFWGGHDLWGFPVQRLLGAIALPSHPTVPGTTLDTPVGTSGGFWIARPLHAWWFGLSMHRLGCTLAA